MKHRVEGFTRTMAAQRMTCTQCGKHPHFFRDTVSRKEYTISGLCQMCQDKVFGVCDDDGQNWKEY